MRKKLLVLSCLGITLAACSENATAPSPQVSARMPASILGGSSHIMGLRGSQTAFSGVSSQAPGINYHGGPIIPSIKVQAIYWANTTVYAGGPAAGTVGTGAQDGSLVGHFLRNLGPSPYYNINTTYNDNLAGGHTVANSVTYTGFWADNTGVPPANGSIVTDATQQAEIIKGFTSGKLTYDPQTIYTIFTVGNTNLGGGFGSQYCAYHGFFSWNGNVVIYSAQPYVGQFLNGCSNGTAAPNGDAAADAEVNVLAHEIEEANTDPQLDAWWDSFTGMENADKCAWTWGTTYNNGTGVANMNLGGKDFLVQQNWINQPTGACLKAFSGGGNQPPVAAFTSSCSGSSCNFNGSGSTDDVGIVSYSWDFGDATAAGTGVTPSHTYGTTGTFQVTLTVTDGGGLSNSITHPVTITGGGNQPPVANFTYSCTGTGVCTFDGTSSTDPDGMVTGYSWKVGANVVATASIFSKALAVGRVFSLTLTVTDNQGATNSITKTVTVSGGTNQPPVAAFTSSCNASHLCTFDGTGSSDPDGTIAAYKWVADGLTRATTSTFTKQFPGGRTFNLTLTVTDNLGATGTITKSVVVP